MNDSATNHNFHLEGAGVNMATGITDIQEVDWTVDFGDGYYTYHCDMHPSLTASFAAGNAPALPAAAAARASVLIPVPPVSSAPSTPKIALPPVAKSSLAGTLKVTLGAKDALRVTKSGKAVTKLTTGTYNVVVSDTSSKRDLSLRRIGGGTTLLTSKAFTGTKTVSIDLAKRPVEDLLGRERAGHLLVLQGHEELGARAYRIRIVRYTIGDEDDDAHHGDPGREEQHEQLEERHADDERERDGEPGEDEPARQRRWSSTRSSRRRP